FRDRQLPAPRPVQQCGRRGLQPAAQGRRPRRNDRCRQRALCPRALPGRCRLATGHRDPALLRALPHDAGRGLRPMSRLLAAQPDPAAVEAALSGDVVSWALLLELQFVSGTIRLSNTTVPVVDGAGTTWSGLGDLVGMSDIEG